ncbi:hypothetical protein ACFLZZ_00540 [Nanoarchaeota archaeon]
MEYLDNKVRREKIRELKRTTKGTKLKVALLRGSDEEVIKEGYFKESQDYCIGSVITLLKSNGEETHFSTGEFKNYRSYPQKWPKTPYSLNAEGERICLAVGGTIAD